MPEQEHLKRILSDIRIKERIARDKAKIEGIKADAFCEAAGLIEDELDRFPKASTPANPA